MLCAFARTSSPVLMSSHPISITCAFACVWPGSHQHMCPDTGVLNLTLSYKHSKAQAARACIQQAHTKVFSQLPPAAHAQHDEYAVHPGLSMRLHPSQMTSSACKRRKPSA